MTYLAIGIVLGMTSGLLEWRRKRHEKRAREIERAKRKATREAKAREPKKGK